MQLRNSISSSKIIYKTEIFTGDKKHLMLAKQAKLRICLKNIRISYRLMYANRVNDPLKPLSYANCEQKVRLAYTYLRWIQRCFNLVKTTGNVNHMHDHGNWHPIKPLHSIAT